MLSPSLPPSPPSFVSLSLLLNAIISPSHTHFLAAGSTQPLPLPGISVQDALSRMRERERDASGSASVGERDRERPASSMQNCSSDQIAGSRRSESRRR